MKLFLALSLLILMCYPPREHVEQYIIISISPTGMPHHDTVTKWEFDHKYYNVPVGYKFLKWKVVKR